MSYTMKKTLQAFRFNLADEDSVLDESQDSNATTALIDCGNVEEVAFVRKRAAEKEPTSRKRQKKASKTVDLHKFDKLSYVIQFC